MSLSFTVTLKTLSLFFLFLPFFSLQRRGVSSEEEEGEVDSEVELPRRR